MHKGTKGKKGTLISTLTVANLSDILTELTSLMTSDLISIKKDKLTEFI